MRRIVDRVLISSGAAISIAGAAASWALQASVSTGSLWPLPALALLDWGLLGFAGFLTASQGDPSGADGIGPGPWAIGGALLPLGVISILSIGPFVILSAALFLLGAAWGGIRRSRTTGGHLRWLAGGLLANSLLLSAFIAIG